MRNYEKSKEIIISFTEFSQKEKEEKTTFEIFNIIRKLHIYYELLPKK